METKQLGTTEQDLALAGELLRQGQLVAFPTETVYGLGADALNETAVAQIYAAKGRPSDNPLIVHVAEKADIAPLVREIPEKAKRLFDRFFPGPLTVILPTRLVLTAFMTVTAVAAVIFIGGNRRAVSAIYNRQQ